MTATEYKKEIKMKFSDQAAAALLMCLQKCIAEETDIMPLLKDLDFYVTDDELFVKNPPHFKMVAQQDFVVE
jgi:hypothetical protein